MAFSQHLKTFSKSTNNDAISPEDFWDLLVSLDYIHKKILALGVRGACHGMSIMAIVHFQNGKKGLEKLNHRLHILNNYAKKNDNFNQFKVDLEKAKLLKIEIREAEKNSTKLKIEKNTISIKDADELIEIDILLQNCAIAHCLSCYNELLQKPVVKLFKISTKVQNALTAFSLVNSISGERQGGLVKPDQGNFLNSYSKKELADVIALLKKELSNFAFAYPVHFMTSSRNHDVCFSYLPKDNEWAYFGIRERNAQITQDNQLVNHIWNNMNGDTRADIGMEVYLATKDIKNFQQCNQKLRSRKEWMVLQTISISSIKLPAIGSKFSDITNTTRAVSCYSFFHNNKIPIAGLIIFSLVFVATNMSATKKAGSIIFSLLWAAMNYQSDPWLNERINQSSLLKQIESYAQPEQLQSQNRL